MKKLFKFIILMLISTYSFAGTNTDNPIKVIIPYPPGGGVDTVFRIFQKYADMKSITFIPEYKNGAQGQIGISYFSNIPQTSNTILLAPISDVIKFNLTHPRNNLVQVSSLSTNQFVIVTGKNPKPLTATEATNKLINATSWGYSSSVLNEITDNILEKQIISRVNPVNVPFNGAASLLQSLMGNHIDLAVLPASVAIPAVESGALTLVATINYKSKMSPISVNADIPLDGYGIFLPPLSTKKEVDSLNCIIANIVSDTEYRMAIQEKYMQVHPYGVEFVNSIIRAHDN